MSVKVPIPNRIANLPTYIPGARPPTGQRAYKLSSNESPFPPLASVMAALADTATEANRYPEIFSESLTAALAQHYGLASDQVLVGNGSEALIEHVIRTFAGPGEQVVYAWRSFEAYPIAVQLAGAASLQVPLDDQFSHDLTALAAAITAQTRICLLCSPNNPTGPALSTQQVQHFLSAVPPQVLVILDEAYIEYVTEPAAANGLDFLDEFPNLVVLRTFSKAYGLAGLRCGYLLGRPKLVSALRAAYTPFAVNAGAQHAALVALGAQDEMRQRVAKTVEGRNYLSQRLRQQGWSIPDSQANFVYLPCGGDAVALAQASASAGVIVRPFDGCGVRVTIGEPDALDIFANVAASWV
ncbi:MAG: histidinol-phosphate transaminase [Bifidobacteriaceae bacterium]|nr:histidinol-phosphate transaminase [Bifidobacteriaceae bacterium]